MANERRGSFFNFVQHNAVAILTVLGVILILIPIPQFLVDVSMILNLTLAIVVLLVVVTTPRASDFETFPRIILFQTIFSTAINISSTRLILAGRLAGGHLQKQSAMVQAFSKIVAGNDLVIGTIVFVILVIFQIIVVTKGSSRISEVAARFSLDSMNQKLFDVDNRLNSGAIDADEAERLKASIRKEIDFYSNMDGSSKFVSGNVKFGIVVTIVNILGGIIMGMVRNDMDISNALETYTKLTIGDGLTSQLPSLIISVATGLLVTGTKSDEPFDEKLVNNFTRDGHIYIITGGILILAGFVLRQGTQFILVPFGAFLIWFGINLSKKNDKKEQAAKQEAEAAKTQTVKPVDDNSVDMLDPLSLELGYALIPLVDKEKGAELLERITRIRTEARLDMGFNIPKIRIQDNVTLQPDDYSFKIDGIEAGHASIRVGYVMCMDTGTVNEPLDGEKTKDPAFGMDAIWLPENRRSEAEAAGYVVVDPPTIISTHITEIIRSHAAEMLDRQAVSVIVDKVKEKNPVLVEEVLHTANISYGTIEKVFQNLLEEKVSIRNYVKILETMANYANVSKNFWDLTAKVREALGLQICMQYVDPAEKVLRVMRLSQNLSELISEHAYYPPDGSKPYVALDPVDRRRWLSAVSSSLAKISPLGIMPIILCASPVRQLVKTAIERENPGVVVISEMEILAAGNNVQVQIIDEIADVEE